MTMIPSFMRRHPWVMVAIPLIGGAILASCSPEQKDRVMHFFFEIPEAESQDVDPSPSIAAEEPTPTTLLAIASQPSKFGHPGFHDHRCSECHVKDQPDLLAASFDAVCLTCHQPITRGHQFVHAPVAAGDCRGCHVHHESDHAGLLVMKADDLCSTCHRRESFENTPPHQAQLQQACTECHQSHGGATRMLLKPPASSPAE